MNSQQSDLSAVDFIKAFREAFGSDVQYLVVHNDGSGNKSAGWDKANIVATKVMGDSLVHKII